MATTSQIPMGIGNIGFKNTVFKRKYQWTFEVDGICGGQSVPRHYVKSVSRPNISIEEIEINHLNANDRPRTRLTSLGIW